MAEKPSYLKLLNGISCAETRAFQYLSAWAEVTTRELSAAGAKAITR